MWRKNDLQREIRRDPPAAFEILARRHAATVYRYVRMWTGSDSQAEDLTQSAFLRAFERREQLREQERFLPWILTIARHTVLNELRRPQYRRELALEQPVGKDGSACQSAAVADQSPNARARLADAELAELIDQALEELDAPTREVFMLRYYGDCKIHEIAAQLKLPPGTVTAKLCRGAKVLRQKLEQRGISAEDCT